MADESRIVNGGVSLPNQISPFVFIPLEFSHLFKNLLPLLPK
jgi:hypothetical protein